MKEKKKEKREAFININANVIQKFVYEYKITKSIMSLYLSSDVTVKKVRKKGKFQSFKEVLV